MSHDLETAAHPEGLRRVAIEPLSRVEGHGKVTLLLDEDGHVQQARLHIVEFRGFEIVASSLPFKGRVRVGMGLSLDLAWRDRGRAMLSHI